MHFVLYVVVAFFSSAGASHSRFRLGTSLVFFIIGFICVLVCIIIIIRISIMKRMNSQEPNDMIVKIIV